MANIPGVQTTLNDGYFALASSPSRVSERVVILARTLTDATSGHHYEPVKYTNLSDVASVHGTGSECFEAFYHALYSGATDIWLCPIPSAGVRATQLVSGYANLESIEPTIIIPYGRSAYVSIDASGNVTRSVPTGDSLGAVATSGTYLSDLATTCYNISTNTKQCIGIIGVTPPSDVTASALNSWIMGSSTDPDSPSGTIVSSAGNMLPTGIQDQYAKYVSVVIAECETAGMRAWDWKYGQTTAYYRSNGAINYAGLISDLDKHDPPTNKVMKNISYMPWKFSITQLHAISQLRCVAFKQNPVSDIIRVCDSPTFASSVSDYRRLSTIRIVGACMDAINVAASKFIGKHMSLWNQNALKTSIVSALETVKTGQAINRYSFSVEFLPVENAANITLIIEPAWELRLIRTTVSVTF